MYEENGMEKGYAKSDVKNGAWEFIRTFMTEEYQGNIMDSCYMPTRQDCFNMMIERAMTTKEYTDEWGRKICPREGSYTSGNKEISIKPMTLKQADDNNWNL